MSDDVIDELRREVDHQIEIYSKHQEIAQNFLRIIISAVGLLLTSASVAFSLSPEGGVSNLLDAFRPDDVVLSLKESSPVTQSQADFLVVLLLMALAYLLAYTLVSLFISAPSAQFKVLSPSEFAPENRGTELRRSPLEKPTEDNYRDLLISNQAIIDWSRQNLDASFRSIQYGVISFAVTAYFAITLAFANSTLAWLALGITFTGSIFQIANKISLSRLRKLVFLQPSLEIGMISWAVIIFAVGSLPTTDETRLLVGLLSFPAVLVPAISGLSVSSTKFRTIIERQVMIGILAFLSFSVSLFVELGSNQLGRATILTFVLILSIGFTTMTFITGHLPRVVFLQLVWLIRIYVPERVRRRVIANYSTLAVRTRLPNASSILDKIPDDDSL